MLNRVRAALLRFVATCACTCGCAVQVTSVMCSWCAGGHKG